MSFAVGVMQMTTTEKCHFPCIRVVIRCINVYLSTQQEIADVDQVVKITETLVLLVDVQNGFAGTGNSLTVFQNLIHQITI